MNMNKIRDALLHPHSRQVNTHSDMYFIHSPWRMEVQRALDLAVGTFVISLHSPVIISLCCGNCVDEKIRGLQGAVVMYDLMELRSAQLL